MAEDNKTTYTPEELKEIDRIMGVVTDFLEPGEKVEAPSPAPAPVKAEPNFEDFSQDTFAADEGAYEEPAVQSEETFDSFDSGIEDVRQQGIEEIEDIVDLTDELREIEEPAQHEDLITEGVTEITDEDFTSAGDMRFAEEPPISFEEPGAEEKPRGPVPATGSPMDQLNALTREEPESLDRSDLADSGDFVGGPSVDFGQAASSAAMEEDFTEFEAAAPAEPEPFAQEKSGVSLGDERLSDIPDLSDISLQETAAIPEADTSEIPEISIDDFAAPSGMEEPASASFDISPQPIEDFGGADLDAGIEALSDLGGDDYPKPSAQAMKPSVESDLPEIDIESGFAETKPSAKPRAAVLPDSFSVEPLDDDDRAGAYTGKAKPKGEEPVDLSERDMRKLKKSMGLFNPAVVRVIKDAIINDLLPPAETRQLVDMIISGKSEDNIRKFLEKKLGRKINLVEAAYGGGRRIISSRPEYTREGRVRQKRLLKATKIFGIAAAVTFVLGILGYQYLYKPYMAKKKIDQGVVLIQRPGDYEQKPKDFKEAEDLFKYVDENYAHNYMYGYNAYGRAYLQIKQVNRALLKLNEAYALDPRHIDTLNNLGFFYAKIPADEFRPMQARMNDWYYAGKKPDANRREQLDIAIDFYKRALVVDPENTTAMYGIGNSYFYQGQYLKSKKYFEDILKVDKKSIVGYSGLLNLYIERDVFAQVAGVNAELREKKLLEKVASPLLAKLALYYLSKRRSDTVNVRIDYAVQSPRIVDENDNTYPAVLNVLQALAKKDPSYPPLQVCFALFHRAQNNLAVMKRYLDKAVETKNYFGALHLMGEYYYLTKEPVKAYKYLNMAVSSYGSQPDFTQEEFYKETETIGKTHAITGNIFYYFFDKVRHRFGDLEDEIIDEEIIKAENYNIAREKYELALSEKYESSELYYNLGRIYYLNRLYSKALDQWLNLYDDFVRNPELMLALGNAFYHERKYDSGKGEYLKLISVFEYEADKIYNVDPGRREQFKIFDMLASAYNNLGAIYQLQGDESKSNMSYWKAIDYAKRIDKENEYARHNMGRAFRPGRDVLPVLDENIPYSISYYRDNLR